MFVAQVGDIEVLSQSYSRMGDEELVVHARGGCIRAIEQLLRKYRSLVEGKAAAYFLAGADHDDVVQEGMIGLFKAIRDFSADHLCAFRSFAELCITRQIITAVKTATRQKHSVLNTCVSTDVPIDDGDEYRTFGDTIPEMAETDPQETVVGRELQREMQRRIGSDLSRLESRVLLRYIEGHSYHDIACELGLQVKQVDNALQRAKKKIARCARDIMFG
jgi:RNA polymerase sporulation-specific sigma factor